MMRRLWIAIAAWAAVVTAPVAAQVVVTTPGPIANGQPAGTPTGPAWMFGTSSFRTAGADLYRMQASDANRLTELSDLYLTPQPAGWRVVFTNFGLDPSSRPAGSARELRPGNTNMLDYVVAFTGANGTGTRIALTFGGAGGVVIGDGGFVISDPVPTPWPGGFLRTSISTAMGAARPRGFTSMGQLGEVRRHLATANPSYAAGGSIANVGLAANTTNGYSPMAVLIPWTRQPSVLEIGDSITQQDDLPQLASPRGMVGGVTRGLDDDATTGRFGVGNFGHHGAQMADFMDLSVGRFGLRYALLSHIRNVLNGRQVWPFSAIWSQGLRNDFSSMYYPEGTPPDTAVADMEARATAWWSFLAKTFPGVPIIQSTITPRTADTTSGRTTLSAQTGNGLGSQSPLQTVNDWIMTRPAPLALAVDLRPAYQAAEDGTGVPKWKQTPLAASGGGTLTAALAAGTDISGTGIRVSATVAPRPGEYLVFEPGSPNNEIASQAVSVVNNGDGSYTVRTPYYAARKAHAAGSIVSTSNSADGTHPGSAAQQAAAAPVIAAKPKIATLTAR
ncbi:MAG: hypothetical protein MIK27_14695 [Sphingomonas sanguinis]|uniref:Uncharacterized protein n=1 Tax=Sphingomonas sanguinis TaxID=33051 RepID=A0ABX1UH30_9SPHN|nr:hypothetical protein [Sphingomonas sanguinis]NNG51497.1 hypothetical protein [Sphingomonas sanguinis]NNG52474.1 hypothetical protein [Sphingomonas sanguinis]